MPGMTPEQQARYAFDFNDPDSLKGDAREIYDANVATWRAARGNLAPEPRAPLFPSSPDTRRHVLDAMVARNEKYGRPFNASGKLALISLIGTESWSDYGAVVLQMAILDTLLSIEELLSNPGAAT
jgi:hypothetical protein